jgi:hypothetical protein
VSTLGDSLNHFREIHFFGKENYVDSRYDDFLDSGISEFDNALYHFFFFGVQLIELRLVGISEASASHFYLGLGLVLLACFRVTVLPILVSPPKRAEPAAQPIAIATLAPVATPAELEIDLPLAIEKKLI